MRKFFRLAHAFGMFGKLRAGWKRALGAYRILVAHKYTTVAGTLAFFLVLSVVPFFFWLTLLLGDAHRAEAV